MDDAQPAGFADALRRVQPALAVYVRAGVPHRADADEVVQAVNLAAWQGRAAFTPGTDLRAWVLRIAHFQVLAYRKRRGRDRLQFDDRLFAALPARADEPPGPADDRPAAVAAVARLPRADRRLVRLRYHEDVPVADIAARLGKSPATVYRQLDRIHAAIQAAVRPAADPDERTGPAAPA